jgi:hypothetical protein
MDRKIISIIAIALWCFGCATGAQEVDNRAYPPSTAAYATKKLKSNDLVFDPVAIDGSALPNLRDLPFPASLKNLEEARPYTGIIKNKTSREVSIPSQNSDATLVIPPHSWIEFTIWTRKSNVTAYHKGKPFYCLNIFAHPHEYPFMCKKYDFMAEIVKSEPIIRHWPRRGPSKLKRRIIKRRLNPPC